MEKTTRNCRSMVPWDMLYADDLVMSPESNPSLLRAKYLEQGLLKLVLKINKDKTKHLISGQ